MWATPQIHQAIHLASVDRPKSITAALRPTVAVAEVAVGEGAGHRLSGETGADDLRDVGALCFAAGAMPGTWLPSMATCAVSPITDIRHAGDGQVGLDEHAAGAVGRRVEPAGGLEACTPAAQITVAPAPARRRCGCRHRRSR